MDTGGGIQSIDIDSRGTNEDEIIKLMKNRRMLERQAFYIDYRFRCIDVDTGSDKWNLDDHEGEVVMERVLQFTEEHAKECNKSPTLNYFLNLQFPQGGVSQTQGCCFCMHRKPNRTHHCRKCKACVLKGDHHCDFLSSCVGYGNYKQFFLMLHYLNITSIYMIINSIQSLRFYVNEFSHVSWILFK